MSTEHYAILAAVMGSDTATLSKAPGMITYLEMCKKFYKRNGTLDCSAYHIWADIYRNVSTIKFEYNDLPISTRTNVTNAIASATTNEQKMKIYKKESMKLTILHMIHGTKTMQVQVAARVYLERPVRIFVSNKRGNIKNIVKGVKEWVTKLRQKQFFPPIPSDLVYGMIYELALFFKAERDSLRYDSPGFGRLHELKNEIFQKRYY